MSKMKCFPGEAPEWTACYLAALAGGWSACGAASEADNAVEVLKTRAAARAAEEKEKFSAAQDKVRAQRTYARSVVRSSGALPVIEVWMVKSETIQGANVELTRGGEHMDQFTANVWALASCTAEEPTEELGLFPWGSPVETGPKGDEEPTT